MIQQQYSFAIIKFVPDAITSEFINIGVLLLCPSRKYLSAKFTTKFSRIIHSFKSFSKHDSSNLREFCYSIQTKIEKLSQNYLDNDLLIEKDISAICNKILPDVDGAIRFSESKFGITHNPENDLNKIFHRLIEEHIPLSLTDSRTDDDIWSVFSKPLKQKHVLSFLNPHKIIAENYDFNFKYCWQNSIWHIHQPLSFDLSDPEGISNKAAAWWGKINLLSKAEQFKVYYLLGEPKKIGLQKAFSKAVNLLQDVNCEHKLVYESEAESFADILKGFVTLHN
jgi:hypothetical protein